MAFSSLVFLFIFLPIVLATYFVAPRRFQNAVLLIASVLFYTWGEQDRVLILFACIVVNWLCGLVISRGPGWRARAALVCAVCFDLGLLAYYKYAAFAVENLNVLLAAIGARPVAVPTIVLPIGISFFTFQALSYVIDVFRNDVPAERSLGRFALYKSLFPQLIAGPIVRYRDVATQLGGRRATAERFTSGVRRFVVGLGKKILIANSAAVTADRIFALPASELTTSVAWLGIAGYTLQIYFDFSGYSDMAIGLGRMFGFELLENFRWPYVATSITEFWRRWHISLSTWFRDYVYIPLGGNRRGRVRTALNLVLVFALCGLWHGALWTFLAWGLFHGAFLLLERTGLDRVLARTPAMLRHAYVVIVVMLGWVFFRSESIPAALGYFRALAGFSGADGTLYPLAAFVDGETYAVLIAGIVGSTPWLPWLRDRLARREHDLPDGSLYWVVVGRESLVFAALAAVFVSAAARLAAGTNNPFIYFRF